ncbi:hypothetical protein FQR65_LT02504 [Abscondita terminalis]|nr:hypothetical protein FQR65_LT02504 [Abscondita terminalis]
MEAVPRLPMISFETKTSTEIVLFGAKLKQYISGFYNEDAESYNNEIHTLETLRAGAVRPAIDISGCQMLKKYYCQLHFLRSRFPMEENQTCSVYFSWRDNYSNMVCSVSDVDFELMNIMFDIGAVHSKLGSQDSRVTPEGMKMACTHFQCAAWAFQTVREVYPQMLSLVLASEVVHFMHLTCLAQAQECILEKSMMDNRKATIIAKVAVQVVDYYKHALNTLKSTELGGSVYNDWIKYLNFKMLYHKAIALLYLGQQAEEQQKMGERVAFYQAAADTLQEACKKSSHLSHQQEISEALAFTSDVIEGKKKAAKNENEFIYHEEVPDRDALPEVKGASLVKGIPFSVNDTDVSGPDIFARLIPMEAHEASSLYSEKKATLLRQLGEAVENKDKALAEFVSSLQLEGLTQMRQANGLTQDLVDRAAAMSAKPTAIQDLVSAMAKLSGIYHDVESMLTEIDSMIKEEEKKESSYQAEMGKRPPSIISTDLTREYTKYQEAHSKACESNQNLHKAMTTHSANLKVLCLPLSELKRQIPSIEFPNSNIDEEIVNEMEKLIGKIDEMKKQRAMLWAQFHDAVKNDDITSRLVTCTQISKEQLFEQELQKHQNQAALIEQNMAAQDNILKALVDAYARFTETRRYIQDVITKRNTLLMALNNSYDTYDDLLAKANKGLEFYNKLETNVSKLLQRIKSTCKVQDEEREQILAKQVKVVTPNTNAPKLKDYLDAKAKDYIETNRSELPLTSVVAAPAITNNKSERTWPPSVRPTPVGSEMTNDNPSYDSEQSNYHNYNYENYNRYYNSQYASPSTNPTYSGNQDYNYYDNGVNQKLNEGMANLMSNKEPNDESQNYDTSPYVYTQKRPIKPESSSGKYSNVKSPYVPGLSITQYPRTNYTTAKTVNLPPAQNFGRAQDNALSDPNVSSDQRYYNTTNTNYPAPNVYADPSASPYYYPNQNTDQTNNFNPQFENVPYVDPNAGTYSTMMATGYETPLPSNLYAPPAPDTSIYERGTSTEAVNNELSNQNNPTYPQGSYQNQQYAEYYNNYQQYNSEVVTANPYAGNQHLYTIPPIEQFQSYTSVANQNLGPYAVSNISTSTPQLNYSVSTAIPSENIQNPSIPIVTPNVQMLSQPEPTRKNSNIDLLSGLDFTINQAPLVPQPEKVEIPKKEVPVVKPIEQQPSSSDLLKSNKTEECVKETVVKKHIEKNLHRNSFDDPILIKEFIQEVDKFEKYVDTLCSKTLNGPTPLEMKWKEILEKQESDHTRRSISVARCYPMKNRFPDILPFDHTRVKLRGVKHDYINASYIRDISENTPELIVTQSPLHSTYVDFWLMVWNEEIELILCLLNDGEIGNDKYWPTSNNTLCLENFSITVDTQNVAEHWTDTELKIHKLDERTTRRVRHIQFRAWPSTLFPPIPVVVSFLNEILQHPKLFVNPILIHCSAGIGRSGFLSLVLCAATKIITDPPTIPDLATLAIKLSAARKNIIRDQEHFKFAYVILFNFVKDAIQKNQLNKKISMRDLTSVQTQVITPSIPKDDDPLSLLDPFWASKRSK